MLVILGKNSEGNVLHAVIGEETTFWMGLHGASVADITPVLNTMDADKKVYLHLTTCESEHELAEQLATSTAAGAQYPFPSGMHVFVPNTKRPAKDTVAPEKVTTVKASKVACCRCGKTGCELVPNIKPPICYPCVRLDMALANSRRGAVNDDAQK